MSVSDVFSPAIRDVLPVLIIKQDQGAVARTRGALLPDHDSYGSAHKPTSTLRRVNPHGPQGRGYIGALPSCVCQQGRTVVNALSTIMSIQLPGTIQSYVDASNRHDVPAILACFDKDAIVRDENQTRRGLAAIETWVVETVDKYKSQFTPLDLRQENAEYVVTIEVSGTFPNSPITLDHHFGVANDKIQSLMIDS